MEPAAIKPVDRLTHLYVEQLNARESTGDITVKYTL